MLEQLLRERGPRGSAGPRTTGRAPRPARRTRLRERLGDEPPLERLVGGQALSWRPSTRTPSRTRAVDGGNQPPESGTSPMPMNPGRTSRPRTRSGRRTHTRARRPPGRAAHRSHHWLLERTDRADVRVVRLLERASDSAGERLELRQVLPRAGTPRPAPVTTTARTPGSAASASASRRALMQCPVERVVDLGAVERDRDGPLRHAR